MGIKLDLQPLFCSRLNLRVLKVETKLCNVDMLMAAQLKCIGRGPMPDLSVFT
jgi:hypothetical protein